MSERLGVDLPVVLNHLDGSLWHYEELEGGEWLALVRTVDSLGLSRIAEVRIVPLPTDDQEFDRLTDDLAAAPPVVAPTADLTAKVLRGLKLRPARHEARDLIVERALYEPDSQDRSAAQIAAHLNRSSGGRELVEV